jgi:(1->4)-alpha-D-glucan 1-alpha-D-glucosylmutase
MTSPENSSRPAVSRIPTATYRIQFNRHFTFTDAAGIAEYLRELGVSDCYASPLFQSAPDSTHGYDVCGYDQINSALGGTEGLERFADRLRQLGLSLLLDIVPNHMGCHSSNCWWHDVLEHGRRSRFASFFDIDWDRPGLEGKVLLPILEDHLEKVILAGKLRLVLEDEAFQLAYYDRRLPLSPESLPLIQREQSAGRDPLKAFNGATGDPNSLDPLRRLIGQQHYRPDFWRLASEQINYRRFFDISDLVSLRMEREEVFEAAHRLVFQLVERGQISGLRIDHPDGLWNPQQYLERLQAKAQQSRPPKRLYVVVEKILSPGETLPEDWPVNGTTGYDFLNVANALFVNAASRDAMDETYRHFTGCQSDFRTVTYQGKKRVLLKSFKTETNALAQRLEMLVEATKSKIDPSDLRRALEETIVRFPVYRTYLTEHSDHPSAQELRAIRKAFTDAQGANDSIPADAFQFLQRLLSLELIRELTPDIAPAAREFVMKFQQLTGPLMAKGLEDTAFYRYHRLISLNEVGGEPEQFGIHPDEFHRAAQHFRQHWPHNLLATATHDTKRGEDARARINVLSELPEEWHDAFQRWEKLNRDKKVEVHGQPCPTSNDEYLLYQSLVGAWPLDDHDPEKFKSFRDRASAFMLKAVREAKANTSWTEPNPDYEKAVQAFTETMLDRERNRSFIDDFAAFQRRVSFFGQFNSLSQTLLKITAPGVPDLYQGTELWDFSFVDPDNRRPVDYALRRNLLSGLKRRFESAGDNCRDLLADLLRNTPSGEIKLYLLWRALGFRQNHKALFETGGYIPLPASGPAKDHVCAFARARRDQVAITIIPRLVCTLTRGAEMPPIGNGVWRDTVLTLPQECGTAGHFFQNVFTRETVQAKDANGVLVLQIAEALKHFPVALLCRID